MKKTNKFSPEVRERAARMVQGQRDTEAGQRVCMEAWVSRRQNSTAS